MTCRASSSVNVLVSGQYEGGSELQPGKIQPALPGGDALFGAPVTARGSASVFRAPNFGYS